MGFRLQTQYALTAINRFQVDELSYGEFLLCIFDAWNKSAQPTNSVIKVCEDYVCHADDRTEMAAQLVIVGLM